MQFHFYLDYFFSLLRPILLLFMAVLESRHLTWIVVAREQFLQNLSEAVIISFGQSRDDFFLFCYITFYWIDFVNVYCFDFHLFGNLQKFDKHRALCRRRGTHEN